MITEELFQKILACREAGDPVKDIADEDDLIEYIIRLREHHGRLLRFIELTEQAYFRTNEDIGANLNALQIWNQVRQHAGLPVLTIQDLPAYCQQCDRYHVNPHLRLK